MTMKRQVLQLEHVTVESNIRLKMSLREIPINSK
jgi:hypothetical protein